MEHEKTGFIGLGQMGAGMANNLLGLTGNLMVFDAVPSAVEKMTGKGFEIAPDVKVLADQCRVVVLCLPQAPDVEAVLFGENGILEKERRGLIILDASTLDRSAARDFSLRCESLGATYCDCPVSGLPARAANGTLTVMFGGPKETFDRVHPLLDATAQSLIYCGDVGSGQAMKAINNIIYNINIVALCEVLPMAVAAGLDPEILAELVSSGSSRSFAADHFIPKMMSGQFSDDFPMGNAFKDILNVQGMAKETNAQMPVTTAMVSTYQSALDAGFGQEPKHAMLKVYEKILGVQFRSVS